jgi:hypothetical protein
MIDVVGNFDLVDVNHIDDDPRRTASSATTTMGPRPETTMSRPAPATCR